MSENATTESCESIDPRVQIELERLNSATDDINKLEVDLDEARANFRSLLCDSAAKLDALCRRLGACVEKARPYYEARMRASEAAKQAQDAAVQYERANSAHSAAREMVYLAEQGLGGRCTLDPAWQEMLNHATQRVNEAEAARANAAAQHERAGRLLGDTTTTAQRLQRELRRAIAKSSLSARRNLLLINITAYQHQLLSLPYFEMKAQFNQQLDMQKIKVQALEKQVGNAKLTYAEALRNLEQISDEIHRNRRLSRQGTPTLSNETVHNNSATATENKKVRNINIYTNKTSERATTKYPNPIASFPDYPFVENGGQAAVYYNQTYIPDNQQTLNGSPNAARNFSAEHQSRRTISPAVDRNSYDSFPHPKNSYRAFDEVTDEYKSLPENISPESSPVRIKNVPEEISGYRNLPITQIYTNTNPFKSEKETKGNKIVEETCAVKNRTTSQSDGGISKSQSNEWTEINLDSSSPEDIINSKYTNDIPYQRFDSSPQDVPTSVPKKRLLMKQITLPVSSAVSEKPPTSSKTKIKLDTNISNWISRSSAKSEDAATSPFNSSRRQSLDNILGPTGEKVKEIFSHGIMMLNISALTERRNSEPRNAQDNVSQASSDGKISTSSKKIPSPLEKTLTYLTSNNNDDDVGSDSDSLASCDMLTEEQIQSLMLDRDIDVMCEQLLGTPISEVCPKLGAKSQSSSSNCELSAAITDQMGSK